MSDNRTLGAFMGIPNVSLPTPSPDGKHIAVFQTEDDKASLRVLKLKKNARSGERVSNTAETQPRWNPSGDQLYYLTQNTDETIIHAADLHGNSDQLISHDETCTLQDVSPDGQFLYYTVGETVWRYDFDERTSEQLIADSTIVPGPAYPFMSESIFCSPDGTRLAYTLAVNDSSEAFHPVGQIHVATADGTEQRALTIDADPVNADGDRLLVRGWHPDSRRLLICDHPFSGHCGIYNIEQDRVEWFGTHLDTSDIPFPGRELPLTVLPDGAGFLAWRLHENLKQLAVHDFTGDVRLFDLQGEVSREDNPRPRFLNDEQCVFIRETETQPGALIGLNVRSGATDLLWEVGYGNVDSEQIVTPKHVQYTTATGETAPGVLYQSEEQQSPAIVELYSGYRAEVGWPQTFRRVVHYLVANGYTVFQAVNPAKAFTSASHANNTAAGKWLQQHDRVDEERVAVYGFSAGGYDALMQAFRYPETWAACVSVDGFPDILAADQQQNGIPEIRMSLGDPAENKSEWHKQNPIDELERLDTGLRCPLLLIRTNYKSDEQFNRLQNAAVDHGWEKGEDLQYLWLQEQGHIPQTVDQRINRWQAIMAFFDEYLKDT